MLAGWVLMTPPMDLIGETPNVHVVVAHDAAMSEWEHDSSYDTAEACEKAKAAKVASTTGYIHEDNIYARCMPIEAVYPAKPRGKE